MAWLRLYDTILDNRKVQTLPPALFKALVNLWCVAKRFNGIIPSVADAAYSMRTSEKDVTAWIDELKRRSLIDCNDDGTFHPHDWDEHQFVSDNVSERVKRHRMKRFSNGASETLHETPKTPPEQSRAEQSRGGALVRATPQKQSKLDKALEPLKAEELQGVEHGKH